MPRVSKRKNYTRQNKSVKRNTSRKTRSLKRNTSRKNRSLKRNTSKKLNRKSRSLRRKNLKGGNPPKPVQVQVPVLCKRKYKKLSNTPYFNLELENLYTLDNKPCQNIFYKNSNTFKLIDEKGRPSEHTTVSQKESDYSRLDGSDIFESLPTYSPIPENTSLTPSPTPENNSPVDVQVDGSLYSTVIRNPITRKKKTFRHGNGKNRNTINPPRPRRDLKPPPVYRSIKPEHLKSPSTPASETETTLGVGIPYIKNPEYGTKDGY